MSGTQTDALALLERLGKPEALSPSAAKADADWPINAHIHLPPNFSAFNTVRQAVDLAAAEGLVALGTSNYYDYRVYHGFASLARERGIFPLFGIEIIAMIDKLRAQQIKLNDPGNPGKVYICGKGITRFDPLSERAASLLETIRCNDSKRMTAMIDAMRRVLAERGFDAPLDEAAVVDRIVQRHGCERGSVYLQERHLAQAFQEVIFERTDPDSRLETVSHLLGTATKAEDAGDAVIVQNELRSHLMKAGRPAFVEETFVSFEHARDLVLALGGIPCYPVLADGASPIGAFETPVGDFIARLKAMNLHAAEFIPTRNAARVLAEYVPALREAGLIVTAGTEHNTLDLIPLRPACAGGETVPEEVEAIFREGACVVAAHQYLHAHGRAGYVDAQGALTGDVEARIAELARLGEAVIHTWREQGDGN